MSAAWLWIPTRPDDGSTDDPFLLLPHGVGELKRLYSDLRYQRGGLTRTQFEPAAWWVRAPGADAVEADALGVYPNGAHEEEVRVIDVPDGVEPGERVSAMRRISGTVTWTARIDGRRVQSVPVARHEVLALMWLRARTGAELAEAFEAILELDPLFLERVLCDGLDEEIPVSWTDGLGHRFPDGLPKEALSALLRHPDRSLRERAIGALGTAGPGGRSL